MIFAIAVLKAGLSFMCSEQEAFDRSITAVVTKSIEIEVLKIDRIGDTTKLTAAPAAHVIETEAMIPRFLKALRIIAPKIDHIGQHDSTKLAALTTAQMSVTA
jgi:hypothetical protein